MSVKVIPTDAVLGAEIRGVDLARPLDEAADLRCVRSGRLLRRRPNGRWDAANAVLVAGARATRGFGDGACVEHPRQADGVCNYCRLRPVPNATAPRTDDLMATRLPRPPS